MPKNGLPLAAKKPKDDDDDDDEDGKAVPGAYNPAEFANLQVTSEVKDLFEYIQRYKP
jgi:intraflagellar transport protein 46